MSEVVVTVTGPTGSGKSRIVSEIEIALKAIGVTVRWTDPRDQRAASEEAWAEANGAWHPDLPTVWLQEINIVNPTD